MMKFIILFVALISIAAAENAFKFKGEGLVSGLDYSVTVGGDVNGDGYADILIGAPSDLRGSGGPLAGTVYVIYGGPTTSLSSFDFSTDTLDPLTTGFTITGMNYWRYFGRWISCAGDINNDGYDDILIGTLGTVFVVYGGEKSSLSNIDLRSQTLDSTTLGFRIIGDTIGFGTAVSNAGDINNDGYDDILIGAIGGNTFVIYGGEKSSLPGVDLTSRSLDPATTGFTMYGWWGEFLFRTQVSIVPDINKDGYDDIIVGYFRFTGDKIGDTGKGFVQVVYGGPKSTASDINLMGMVFDPAINGFLVTGKINQGFDWAASGAGDVNGDGYNDFILGAKNVGEAYVFYGGEKSSFSNFDASNPSLDPATTGFIITGSRDGWFGYSVSSAGDLNQDGYDDILIGAPHQSTVYAIYGGPSSSMSHINLGARNLDKDKTGFVIMGSEAGFGDYVTSGDVNKDGVPDFMIGAGVEGYWTGSASLYIPDGQLPDHCQTFTDSFACRICAKGYSLLGTQCVVSCPAGTYSGNGVCKDCPATCLQCTSGSVCQECKPSYLKYHSRCLASCPAKTYLSGSDCLDCSTGCSKCTNDSVCEVCDEGYSLSDSKVCLSLEKKEIKVSAALFEGTFLAGAALSAGGSIPFNFALAAKILRNMKYLDVTVSLDLTKTFYSWKVADGFLSAPGSWGQKSTSKTIPTVFSRYGLDPEFLINFWRPLVLSLIGLVVYVVFKSMEVYMARNGQKGTLYKISRQVNVAASNFALTVFYCNLDDVMLYFVIDIRSTGFDSSFRVLSSVLAIVLLVFGGLFMLLHLIFVRKYQQLKNEPALLEIFLAKCENLKLIFKDFKGTSFFKQSFLLMILCRSLLSSVIFATLFDYPILQTTLLLVLNIAMFILLLVKNPFKSRLSKWGQLFCEIIILIVSFSIFLLSMFDYAKYDGISAIEKLSRGVIVLNLILLIGCSIMMILSLLKALSESCFKRRKLAKVYAVSFDQCSAPGGNQRSELVPGRFSAPRSLQKIHPYPS